MAKTEQLQLRVSAEQKARFKALAASSGEDVSHWILRKLLPAESETFQQLVDQLKSAPPGHSLTLGELNGFLTALTASKLESAIPSPDLAGLSDFHANYVAAMVEYACARKRIPLPDWANKIAPLDAPWYASELKSLR